jgi:hypothetical protein
MIEEVRKDRMIYVKLLGGAKAVETILDQLDLKPKKDNPDALEITRANWLS